MRMVVVSFGVLASVVFGTPAAKASSAEAAAPQAAPSDAWRVVGGQPTTVSDLLTRIDRESAFAATDRPGFGPQDGWSGYSPPARDRASPWVAASRDVWFENNAFDDRLRLRTEGPVRRADGSPLRPDRWIPRPMRPNITT